MLPEVRVGEAAWLDAAVLRQEWQASEVLP
jgi:hypothetical protein